MKGDLDWHSMATNRLGTALVAVTTATAALAATPACGSPTPPAIYLVPHQDDEVLTMGADIAAHVEAGRKVIIVMVTDGAASGARDVLCRTKEICLSKTKFSEARNREFIAAMTAMGIPRSNLYFEDLPDGGLSLTVARRVVNKWAAAYPGASMKTMSVHDAHRDHANLGKALVSAVDDGTVDDARFLQYRTYWQTKPVNGWYIKSSSRVTRAAAQYSVYNPTAGRYAIGAKWSVASAFAQLKADPRSKVHAR